MGKSFFVIKLHFKVLIIVVLIFLAASYSNSSKFSYLDGVPFAINPIFLNENEQEKFAKTESLNYNLNNSLAILNSKVNLEFFFQRLYN
jgi:hypothetical protein